MNDFLFGVMCGGTFMLPGVLFGYAHAMMQAWKREDEVRERLDECHVQCIACRHLLVQRQAADFARTHDALGRPILPPGAF